MRSVTSSWQWWLNQHLLKRHPRYGTMFGPRKQVCKSAKVQFSQNSKWTLLLPAFHLTVHHSFKAITKVAINKFSSVWNWSVYRSLQKINNFIRSRNSPTTVAPYVHGSLSLKLLYILFLWSFILMVIIIIIIIIIMLYLISRLVIGSERANVDLCWKVKLIKLQISWANDRRSNDVLKNPGVHIALKSTVIKVE